VVLALLAAVRPWPILLVVAFVLVAPAALFLTRSLEFQELKGMVVSFRSER
jgi:hypothetical protein